MLQPSGAPTASALHLASSLDRVCHTADIIVAVNFIAATDIHATDILLAADNCAQRNDSLEDTLLGERNWSRTMKTAFAVV